MKFDKSNEFYKINPQKNLKNEKILFHRVLPTTGIDE